MPILHISPTVTLDRPSNPRFRPSLTVTYRPGLGKYPAKLKYGWVAFFVGRYGTDRTVVTYRRPTP